MAVKLILVRHGETDWNKNSKFQGSKDIPLNNIGKEQAKKLANRLKDEKINVIYSSDLSRAFTTANLVAQKHQLSVIKKSALQEIDFGKWEGLTFSELEEKYQTEFKKWQQDPINNGAPAGENLAEFQERTVKCLEEIIARHDNQTVLIVAHGGVVRILVATLLEMPVNHCWRLKQTNTAVSIVNIYEDDIILELFNSTAHLD